MASFSEEAFAVLSFDPLAFDIGPFVPPVFIVNPKNVIRVSKQSTEIRVERKPNTIIVRG